MSCPVGYGGGDDDKKKKNENKRSFEEEESCPVGTPPKVCFILISFPDILTD